MANQKYSDEQRRAAKVMWAGGYGTDVEIGRVLGAAIGKTAIKHGWTGPAVGELNEAVKVGLEQALAERPT